MSEGQFQVEPEEVEVLEAYELSASDVAAYSGDTELRYAEGPDTELWERVVDSIEFREDLYGLDEILGVNGYSAEMHVGESSFREVEFYNKPRPSTLVLSIDEAFDEFVDDVRHPFFSSMERDELKRPKDADVAVKFGGYSEVKDVPTRLDNIDLGVPTFQSYSDVLMQDAFSFDKNDF